MSPDDNARQARSYLIGAAQHLADGRISEGTQAMVRAQMATAHALLAQGPVELPCEFVLGDLIAQVRAEIADVHGLDTLDRHPRKILGACDRAEDLIAPSTGTGEDQAEPFLRGAVRDTVGGGVSILSDIASPVQIVGLTGPGTWLAWDRAPRDLSELEGPTW